MRTVEELDQELDKLAIEIRRADTSREYVVVIDKLQEIKRRVNNLTEKPEQLVYKLYHFFRENG